MRGLITKSILAALTSIGFSSCTGGQQMELREASTAAPTSGVTYTQFLNKVYTPVCAQCHVSGGGLPNWGNYQVALSKCASIGSRVASKSMPPFGALTEEQLEVVALWTGDGCPEDPLAPAPVPVPEPEPTATATPEPEPTSTSVPTGSPSSSPSSGPAPTPVDFYAIAKTNVFTPICGVCHNPNWSARNWQVESTAVTYKSNILNRAVTTGTMPPSGPLQASSKQYIVDWYDSATYTFSWNTGLWSECADSQQSRTVTCNRTDNNALYADAFCSKTVKPATSQSCTVGGVTYEWVYSGWSSCSAECGGGTQTRSYTCQDSSGAVVANSLCNPATQPGAGDTSQACNTQACPTYSWNTYPWSSCQRNDNPTLLAICGGGSRTRSVNCINESNSPVADSFCDAAAKPATSEACATDPCPPGSVEFTKAECLTANSIYMEGRVTGFQNGWLLIEEVPWSPIQLPVDGQGAFKMLNPAGGWVISCPSKLRGYTENGIYFDNVIPTRKY